MSKWTKEVCATTLALALAGTAVGQVSSDSSVSTSLAPTSPSPAATASPTSPGQARVATKFSAPFVTMAGSPENAAALANALRTGTPATLTYTSTSPDGKVSITTVTITPPTKPMGWGNVSHSLALAQFALTQSGITNPTGAQLQAALTGGDITTADGKTVTLAGVLQQRADGMGWGKIAQGYGTTMGAMNRGIKAPTVVATSPPPTAPTSTTGQTTKRLTAAGGTSTSAGQSAKGITTAGGTATGSGQGAKGITTASGATSGGSAHGGARGNGNAYGRGVVTASGGVANVASAAGASSGGSSGVVTGNGAAARGVVTADPGNGAGSAKAHGKGKGGG